MEITDILARMGGLQSIARELGISESQVASGAEALAPAILGGFKKQAQSQPSGLEGLGGLLGRLGGGGLLDNVLGSQPTDVAQGNDVLGQIFGSKDVSRTVAQNAASKSGLDPALLKKMLPMLAMLVGGYISKKQGGGLGGLLGGLMGGKASPAGGKKAGGGLASMLDLDGDGNALDDIMRMVTGKGRALILAALIVSAGLVAVSAQTGQGDPDGVAKGLHQLFLHDVCTGEYPPQPDTCIHKQLIEKVVTIGGKAGAVYDVRLRIRGLFEPTSIREAETPDAAHPYYQVGGSIRQRDWSAWHIEVSDPKQTYWLNHYPRVSHTIYKEDFEATIPMAAGATVTVRVVDGNDRQMDNTEPGLPDRMQIIEGVTAKPLDGQMLRLDVVKVSPRK